MMQTLIAAGLRLAEALRAENQALAALDLSRAAPLAAAKIQAAEIFAREHDACVKTHAKAAGPERAAAERLAEALGRLTAENRSALERAIALQSRVIETIAGAARNAALRRAGNYGAGGGPAALRETAPLALFARL